MGSVGAGRILGQAACYGILVDRLSPGRPFDLMAVLLQTEPNHGQSQRAFVIAAAVPMRGLDVEIIRHVFLEAN